MMTYEERVIFGRYKNDIINLMYNANNYLSRAFKFVNGAKKYVNNIEVCFNLLQEADANINIAKRKLNEAYERKEDALAFAKQCGDNEDLKYIDFTIMQNRIKTLENMREEIIDKANEEYTK